jgi:hypothetical protein
VLNKDLLKAGIGDNEDLMPVKKQITKKKNFDFELSLTGQKELDVYGYPPLETHCKITTTFSGTNSVYPKVNYNFDVLYYPNLKIKYYVELIDDENNVVETIPENASETNCLENYACKLDGNKMINDLTSVPMQKEIEVEIPPEDPAVEPTIETEIIDLRMRFFVVGETSSYIDLFWEGQENGSSITTTAKRLYAKNSYSTSRNCTGVVQKPLDIMHEILDFSEINPNMIAYNMTKNIDYASEPYNIYMKIKNNESYKTDIRFFHPFNNDNHMSVYTSLNNAVDAEGEPAGVDSVEVASLMDPSSSGFEWTSKPKTFSFVLNGLGIHPFLEKNNIEKGLTLSKLDERRYFMVVRNDDGPNHEFIFSYPFYYKEDEHNPDYEIEVSKVIDLDSGNELDPSNSHIGFTHYNQNRNTIKINEFPNSIWGYSNYKRKLGKKRIGWVSNTVLTSADLGSRLVINSDKSISCKIYKNELRSLFDVPSEVIDPLDISVRAESHIETNIVETSSYFEIIFKEQESDPSKTLEWGLGIHNGYFYI